MKRKMVCIGIFLMLGLFFASFFPWRLLPIFGGLMAVSILLCCCWKWCLPQTGVTAITALLTGIFLFISYTLLVMKPILLYENVETIFTGKIVLADLYDDDHARYLVKGTFPDGPEAKVSVYTDDLGGEYGDRITIHGVFVQPENTDLFQAKRYWQGKGVFLEAEYDQSCVLEKRDGYWLTRTMAKVRERLQRRFFQFAGSDAGSIMTAMLLGEKQYLDEQISDAFYEIGIGHILAVSGLHLVFLLQIWFICSRRLHRYIQIGGSAVFIVLFALLVQTPVSILRAGFMVLLSQSGKLFFRQTDTLNSLCLAVLILAVQNPCILMDTSFLFTVSGTFGIGVLGPWMTKSMQHRTWYHLLRNDLLQYICVTACLFPVSVLCDLEISLLSPIMNVFLIPVCLVILFCTFGIALLGWIDWIGIPLAAICKGLCRILTTCVKTVQERLPLSIALRWDALSTLTGVCILLMTILYLMYRSRRATAILLSVSMMLLTGAQILYQALCRRQISVAVLGRREEIALVIFDHDSTIIIDCTGDRRSTDYVTKYLKDLGIRSVDLLCLLQNPASQCSVYESALKAYNVEQVLLGSDCALRDNQRICGQIPDASADGYFVMEKPDFEVLIQEENVQITIQDQTICIASDSTAIPLHRWDYVVTGKLDESNLPDCTWLAVLEETELVKQDSVTLIGENNIRININQSEIRSLSWQ